MYETLGLETLTPRAASLILGLVLGLAFGILAQRTRFCFRRSVAGAQGERRSAAGVWLTALGVAVLGTQIAVALGWITFADHRFTAPDLPWLALSLGGLLFGAGMVLTRGCVSRLAVLGGGGNLRALSVLVIFAVVAHATLKGVLAPLRVALGGPTLSLGEVTTLADLPGGALLWAAVIAAGCAIVALRSGNRAGTLVMAALIGLLPVLGWVGTGYVLYDEFDPIAMESLTFTLPSAEMLFWLIASSSIPAGFGVGLVGGTLAGAFVAALLARELQWASFESPRQTGRYALGAALMGVGGVLAGGCTLGAGLSGVPTLAFSAILAILCIALGGGLTVRLVDHRRGEAGDGRLAARAS